MRRTHDKSMYLLLVAAMLLLGIVLRMRGIGFGLPIESSLYIRPDESLLVQPALHMVERRGDPQFYVYSALVIEMTTLVFEGYFRPARSLGWTEAEHLVEHFAARHSPYFMVPRWISVFAGILTIPLVLRLTQRLTEDRRLALLASLLYATAPLAVRDAHFGVTDNVMVFFLVASLLKGMAYAAGREGPARAGALFGLAAAGKYTAFLLGPRLVAAVLFRESGSSWRVRLRRLEAGVSLRSGRLQLLLNAWLLVESPRRLLRHFRFSLFRPPAAILDRPYQSGYWANPWAGLERTLRRRLRRR